MLSGVLIIISVFESLFMEAPDSQAPVTELAQALYEASDPDGAPWNKWAQAVRDP